MSESPFGNSLHYRELSKQYHTAAKLALLSETDIRLRVAQLQQQIKSFFLDLTEGSKRSFTNHFGRMHYVVQSAKVNSALPYYLHQFDKEATAFLRNKKTRLIPDDIVKLGVKALLECLATVTSLHTSDELIKLLPTEYEDFNLKNYTVSDFKQQIRVIVLENLEAHKKLRVQSIDDPSLDLFMHYDRGGFNENFVKPAVEIIINHYELPIEVNLLAVEVDEKNELIPGHLIIDPDFLVDITSISKCFDFDGPKPMKYLLGRVTPFRSSVSLIAGNVANNFLDSAMTGQMQSFEDSFLEIFKQYPLQLAILNDDDVRSLMNKCKDHYDVIKTCVKTHFPQEKINTEDTIVEPSFYAERYGIQGRLDVFLPPQDDKYAAIIELKSGKVFRPNEHKVNLEHYIQTLLYDLLIKAVYKDQVNPKNYILYSSEKEQPLRYAPPNKAQQYEALNVRNQMMATEQLLANSTPGKPCPLDWLSPHRYSDVGGFIKTQLENFYAAYSGLSEIEKKYFRAFTGFIAREQRLAKIGNRDQERLNGQATLWQESLENKIQGYSILHDLAIITTAIKDDFPVLAFKRAAVKDRNDRLTTFRRGDIVVLYAGDARKQAILKGQIYKGTIIKLTEEIVEVRLRASQPDLSTFQELPLWNIEPDLFDSSFTKLYRNLAEFSAATPKARQLALGIKKPKKPDHKNIKAPTALTAEQGKIFKQIINAQEYYVLWGPPGTGKTSMMLHHLCSYFVNQTSERILVLGFTNRAVDEICSAINKIGGDIKQKYIRIGSSFGCSPSYSDQLLQERIKNANSREDIRKLLKKQRIVTGTFSSVLGKGESLFQLVKFDRLFIDEASQLLEPAMINLVAKFPKTVLIGDHRQLPAVVLQADNQTKIEDEDLKQIGLIDMRNSLFERLYLKCQAENWDWAYGQLTRQGRMHNELAEYANIAFYEKTLKGLEIVADSKDWQKLPNSYACAENASQLAQVICDKSFVFVNTQIDLSDQAFKTNSFEADAIVKTIETLLEIKKQGKESLSPEHIGIITPYRAQIACIRSTIEASSLDQEWNEVNIDTVERYQGSSYKIILYSLCANQAGAVSRLNSYNSEKKDRKLNVALTRAKERVIAFGNIELLKSNTAYRHFIEFIESKNGIYDADIA